MGLDAALDVVPDRTDGQFAFEGSEGGFYFGKLHILTPEGVGIHGIEIGAQQIGALAQLGSPQTRLIPRPQQPAAAVFNRAEHGPALGITLFETAKPTFDFARVLKPSARYNAAQSAQRAVQSRELASQDSRFLFGPLQTARQDKGLSTFFKKLNAHPGLSSHLLPVALKPIFDSFEVVLTRFTLLEFGKSENVVQLLWRTSTFSLIIKYVALRTVESTSATDVFSSQARQRLPLSTDRPKHSGGGEGAPRDHCNTWPSRCFAREWTSKSLQKISEKLQMHAKLRNFG